MRRYVPFVFMAIALYCTAGLSASESATPTRHGVDLGVGRGSDSHRPNILVAWRNTERVLEVEVLVRNLGDQAGRGNVRLEICDDEGRQLLTTKPFPVTV